MSTQEQQPYTAPSARLELFKNLVHSTTHALEVQKKLIEQSFAMKEDVNVLTIDEFKALTQAYRQLHETYFSRAATCKHGEPSSIGLPESTATDPSLPPEPLT